MKSQYVKLVRTVVPVQHCIVFTGLQERTVFGAVVGRLGP